MSSVHSETSKTLISGSTAPRWDFVGQVAPGVRRMLDTLLLWQQRAIERRHLAQLSEHHLKDIGISRADVEHEVSKPFWVG